MLVPCSLQFWISGRQCRCPASTSCSGTPAGSAIAPAQRPAAPPAKQKPLKSKHIEHGATQESSWASHQTRGTGLHVRSLKCHDVHTTGLGFSTDRSGLCIYTPTSLKGNVSSFRETVFLGSADPTKPQDEWQHIRTQWVDICTTHSSILNHSDLVGAQSFANFSKSQCSHCHVFLTSGYFGWYAPAADESSTRQNLQLKIRFRSCLFVMTFQSFQQKSSAHDVGSEGVFWFTFQFELNDQRSPVCVKTCVKTRAQYPCRRWMVQSPGTRKVPVFERNNQRKYVSSKRTPGNTWSKDLTDSKSVRIGD